MFDQEFRREALLRLSCKIAHAMALNDDDKNRSVSEAVFGRKVARRADAIVKALEQIEEKRNAGD